MHRGAAVLSLLLALSSSASATEISLDQVILDLPGWSALPDRPSEGVIERRAASPDGKSLVTAWSGANPKATVEQGLIFFLLPLVGSTEELRSRAAAMAISTSDVDFIVGLANASGMETGGADGKIESAGAYDLAARKIYYIVTKPNDRGDITLYLITRGSNAHSTNTAVFFGPHSALKDAATFAKMFRESATS